MNAQASYLTSAVALGHTYHRPCCGRCGWVGAWHRNRVAAHNEQHDHTHAPASHEAQLDLFELEEMS